MESRAYLLVLLVATVANVVRAGHEHPWLHAGAAALGGVLLGHALFAGTCAVRPWTWRARLERWHPDSPGVRVRVVRYLPWWRRSDFATLREVLRAYR